MSNANEKAKQRQKARIKGIASTIIVAIVAVFAVLLLGLRIFGFDIYTVMSGSMEPKFHVGSLIYVRKAKAEDLHEGDVITFMLDEETIVTHRIYEIDAYGADGDPATFITKGDANEDPDAQPVRIENVLGKPSFSIPVLGYAAWYIQRPPGIYIALVAGTLLIAAVFLPTLMKKKEATASREN